MDNRVSFVSKVTKVKTRTKDGKAYYVYRTNIPKEESEKLQLSNDDYLFVQSAMKAKWYHMVKWQEMSMTWNMLPQQLKNEIIQSGVYVPIEMINPPQPITSPTRSSSFPEEKWSNVSGLTSVIQSRWM